MKFGFYSLWICLVLISLQGETFSWKTKEVEIPYNPKLTEWVATYDFTNTGAKPVTIKTIESCCNCTTWKIDKMTYGAGEKGRISLIFKTEGKFGVQQKMVTLTFEDGSRDLIVMKGVIPSLNDYLSISADPIQWKPNEERITKKVTLTFKRENSIKIKSVKSTDPRFTVKIIGESKQGLELEVVPPESKERLAASLEIITDFPRTGDEVKRFVMMAM